MTPFGGRRIRRQVCSLASPCLDRVVVHRATAGQTRSRASCLACRARCSRPCAYRPQRSVPVLGAAASRYRRPHLVASIRAPFLMRSCPPRQRGRPQRTSTKRPGPASSDACSARAKQAPRAVDRRARRLVRAQATQPRRRVLLRRGAGVQSAWADSAGRGSKFAYRRHGRLERDRRERAHEARGPALS